jgi:hypothetical protein
MRRLLALAILVGCGTGCRDSADALARDYRNVNNEAVDALMMITGEPSAKMMLTRVLKEYPKRIQLFNDRVKNWKQNNEKTDYGEQIYTSDSVVILFVENEMNMERLKLEKARLQKLVSQMTEEERDTRRQGGEANPTIDPKALWPNLTEVIDEKSPEIEKIQGQLEKGSDVMTIYNELGRDEKFLKSAKMKTLKESFEKKYEDFKQNRIRKFSP